jgi:1-acyl-sn-glycerol-3-phosphate acyltransferase
MRREMNWIWRIGAPLVRGVMALVFRVRVEGLEHIPERGAVILAPNHLSVLDGPAVSAVTAVERGRPVRNLVAAEVFHGLIGRILELALQIPIQRGGHDREALGAATAALQEGTCIGIFPEGRVNEDPRAGLQRIRSGLTRLAIPAATPVVPVGIWGTQALWPRDRFVARALLHRPRLALVYGEPIVQDAEGAEAPVAFRRRYLDALAVQVDRARALAIDRA